MARKTIEIRKADHGFLIRIVTDKDISAIQFEWELRLFTPANEIRSLGSRTLDASNVDNSTVVTLESGTTGTLNYTALEDDFMDEGTYFLDLIISEHANSVGDPIVAGVYSTSAVVALHRASDTMAIRVKKHFK